MPSTPAPWGGIYANRIRLVANANGVGVRIAAPVATQTGELALAANGVLAITGAFLSGPQLTVTAPTIQIDSAGGTYAGRATLHTDRLANAGLLYAQDELQLWLPEITALPGGTLQAGNVHLRSDTDIRVEGQGLVASAELTLTAGGNLALTNTVLGADGDVTVQAQNLQVSNDAVLFAGGSLGIDVRGDLLNQGLLFANEDLAVLNSVGIYNGDELHAASMIAMNGDLTLFADARIVNTGSVIEAVTGNLQLGSAERPVPLVDNRRTGLQLSAWAHTELGWSTTEQGNEKYDFPDDAWWLEHCYYRSGHCGNPLRVDEAVAAANAARITENAERASQGLAPLALVDYRRFDPQDLAGVDAYLEEELGRGGWFDATNHENRRFIRRTDEIVSEVIADSGRAAQLLAGAGLDAHVGDLVNRDSLISAAGDLSITVSGTVLNESTPLTDDMVRAWWARWYQCDYDDFGDKDCDNKRGVPAGYPASESLLFLREHVPAVIEAGGTLSMTGGAINNQGHYDETGWQPSGLFPGLPPASDPAAPQLPYLGLPTAPGLFVVNTAPGSRYLVETNPHLASYAGFLGSDYLLARLGVDPAGTLQRLGDGFYELQLIRETLLAMTGSRFLGPDFTDEQAQYLALLDNGIYAADALQLSLGVALTAEQINALTADMVWLEAREVAGYRVLVPVVYLVPGSAQLRPTGALIAADTVALEGGSVANTGTLRADNDLSLRAQTTLRNDHGEMAAGGTLTAVAGGDLVNRGGSLRSGGDMLLASTGGNVLIATPVERIEQTFGGNSAYDTRIGGTATVQAGGPLEVRAAGDVQVLGAQVAGNGVAVQAGGNVMIASQEVTAGGRWQGGDYLDDHVRQLRASVSSLTGLLIDAEQDLAVVASGLQAEGDLALSAGRDVLLLAGTERDDAYRHREKDGTFEDTASTVIRASHRLAGSGIVAGGDIAVTAGRDGVFQASAAQAGGNLALDVGNDLKVQSGVEQASFSLAQARRGTTTFRDHQEGWVSQSLAQAGLVAGGDLHLNAGRDVALMAAQLQAAGTLSVGASTLLPDANGNVVLDEQGLPIVDRGTLDRGSIDNVTIGTVALTQQSWHRTQKGYRGALQDVIAGVSAMVAPYADLFTAGQAELPEIELSRKDSVTTRDTTHAGSLVAAEQLAIAAQGTVALVNADLAATDRAQIQAGALTIDAAADVHERVEVHARETVTGLGYAVGDSELTMGGAQHTDTRQTHSTRDVIWNGSRISAGELVLKADQDIVALNAELSALGDAIIEAGGTVALSGRADEHTSVYEERTEVESAALALRNAYLDAVNAVLAVEAARDALSAARDALSDAERRYAQGQVSDGALDDYRTMVDVAAAKLAEAIFVTATAALAAAKVASTSAGTGFYLSGSASREVTTTRQESAQTTWQGSSLQVGGDAVLAAGEGIDVIGSQITTAGELALAADRINLGAGEERTTSSSRTHTESQSVSLTMKPNATSGTLGVGVSRSEADSSALHYVNAQISAGGFQSTSESLRVAGAQITAGQVAIQTDALVVASLQDSLHSESHAEGGHIGLGGTLGAASPDTVSVGINQADGQQDRHWVSEQTAILGTDSIRVRAQNTVLTGAVIAHAERAEDGTLIDRGHLDFRTGTLTATALQDTDSARSEGYSVATSIGPRDFVGQPAQTPTGTTTLGLVAIGHDRAQLNRATLGRGTVVVGDEARDAENPTAVPGLNRDLAQAQALTRDQETGALDVSLTIDHRLLTEEGRKDIADDVRNAGNNAAGLALTLGGESLALTTAALAELTQAEANGRALLANSEGASRLAQTNPEAAAALAAYQRGDFQGLLETQEGLQALADALGVDANTRVTSLTSERGLAGTTDHQLIAVDVTEANRDHLVATLGHEVGHNQGIQSDWLADLAGWSVNLGLQAGVNFNQDRVDLAFDNLPDYTDTQLLTLNNALLYQNNRTLEQARADHPEKFQDRQLHKTELERIATNYRAYAVARGISPEQAFQELVQTAAKRVDAGYANDPNLALAGLMAAQDSDQADAFLTQLGEQAGPIKNSDGVSTKPFSATGEQFLNPDINADHLRDSEEGLFGANWNLPDVGRPVLYGLGWQPRAGSYAEALARADQWASDQRTGQAIGTAGLLVGGVAAPIVASVAAGEAALFAASPSAYLYGNAYGINAIATEAPGLFTEAGMLNPVYGLFGLGAGKAADNFIPFIDDATRTAAVTRGTGTTTAVRLSDIPDGPLGAGAKPLDFRFMDDFDEDPFWRSMAGYSDEMGWGYVVPNNLPAGATFEGTLYRAVGQGHDPLLIHPGNIAATHRYTGTGQGGLYFATGEHVVEAEFVSNGASLVGKQMHVFANQKVPDLLDLSNPAVRDNLGVSLGDLTRTGGTQTWRYEVTNPLGAWAQQNGYRGIVAPSAQADGGVNLIIFDAKGLK